MDESEVPASFEGDGYRQILDTAPDAIVVVDVSSTIKLVNAQAEKLFGRGRAGLLGQHLDLLIPARLRGGHGVHLARFFASPMVRGMGSGLELFGVRSDGVEIPIEVSLSPLRLRGQVFVSAAIRDISERRQIQAAVKLNADRLTSAIESIQDAFALFGADDRLLQCNSAYRVLIGDRLPGPLVGRHYGEILDAKLGIFVFESDEARAAFRAKRVAERRDPAVPYDVRTTDGRSFRVANRRTTEGGIVQTIWDLTDDVRQQEELREARRAAEAGSAAKSEFLSSMSHELRTPLNAVLGFAQLLQRDKKEPLTERHRERVHQILKGGEHLLRLIDDILDLSRIEAGNVSISAESVGVAEVLSEVRVTLEPTAVRAGVQIDLETPTELAATVRADRTRFAQILMNYGSNAIKYNRPGGRVIFALQASKPGFVRVEVSDTGVGIPLEKQDKIFQPFQRAGQETGPIEGTGIGLAISRRLAELMGGVVGFQSEQGQGSRFWVELPAHVEPASAGAGVAAGRSSRLDNEGKGLILYVEDNPANISFMVDLLEVFEGLDLLTAPTAELGVELARSRQPRIIIMDINLPGMSGLDALKQLLAWPETAAIPVIALTAAASERDRQRGEQAGFYRYLTKPVKVSELEAALESLLLAPAG